MAVLGQYSKCIAYICPYCGRLTKRHIGLFDIPHGKTELCCSEENCGEPVLILGITKDKYAIDAVCSACGEMHRFTLKSSLFWQKDIAVLSCPETMVDIVFFGDEDKVDAELEGQDELYREAAEDINRTPELRIYFDLIHIINEIAKQNNVVCSRCGGSQADVELTDEGILIICRGCGATKLIKVCRQSCDELLETGTIVLE